MMSTFIDTIIVCTMTGLVIMVTGAWNSGVSGAALTSNAFAMALPGFGQYFLAIALAVFAYHPRLGLLWRKCWEYLAGTAVEKPYRVLWTLFVMIGAITHLDFVWLVADTLNAVMAFPNLVSLVLLSPVVVKINNEYFASRMADAVARRATGAGEPAGNRPPGGRSRWPRDLGKGSRAMLPFVRAGRCSRDPPLHPQDATSGDREGRCAEREQRPHLGGVLHRARREGDARHKERDGEADRRHAADHEDVARPCPRACREPRRPGCRTA